MSLVLPPLQFDCRTKNGIDVYVRAALGRACYKGTFTNIGNGQVTAGVQPEIAGCCPTPCPSPGCDVTVFDRFSIPQGFLENGVETFIPEGSEGFATNAMFSDVNSAMGNGEYGDSAQTWCIPPANQFFPICFEKGVNVEPGEEFNVVPYKCQAVSHYTRKRPEGRQVTLNDMFVSNCTGLNRIRNIPVTLWLEVRPECSTVATEVIILTDVLFQNVPLLDSTSENESIDISATGTYNRHFIFAPPKPPGLGL